MTTFGSAEILIPRVTEMEKWAVIACDQFTSQPAYWERVRQTVGEAPSALHLILPEAELDGAYRQRVPGIHAAMRRCLDEELFDVYENAFVYVERRLLDGQIRRGLVGAIDLEQYDFNADAASAIRATERTVLERIPPRMAVRRGAPLELPHVLLLCDDVRDGILAPLTAARESLPALYDFELMESGGRIRGWLVQGEAAAQVQRSLDAYARETAARCGKDPLLFAVGDGNHSLATAKSCWEELKKDLPEAERQRHPARRALVELENLRDDSQQFEPIHRVVKHTDVQALLAAAREAICAPGGSPLPWCSGGESGVLTLDTADGRLPVDLLQDFLDRWLAGHPGEIDYIHGDDTLRSLSGEPDSLGFLLPAIGKDQLFPGIMAGGVLPRKTFSMGHAQEKRYYLEARRIG